MEGGVMNMEVSKFPLQWPENNSRTLSRESPRFKTNSFAAERDHLLAELGRLKAKQVIISSNILLRQDGLPYSGQRQPTDPGVVVYFQRQGRDLCLACDRWSKVEDNVRAIADAIECIRMIERRGTGQMVDAAFSGFAQLPPKKEDIPWTEVFDLSRDCSTHIVQETWKRMVLLNHPDRGGSVEKMAEINAAFDRFKKERGL
jgi:hypothetical protein